MIGAIVDWARQVGATRVQLEVRRDNAWALRVYRRHGFIDAATEPSVEVEPDEQRLIRPF